MNVNTWKIVLGIVVRHSLSGLAAFLIAHRMLSQNEAGVLPLGDMTDGIVLGILALSLSLWQKAVSRWKFFAALQTPPPSDPGAASSAIAVQAGRAPIGEKLAALAK